METIATKDRDNLIAGDFPIVTDEVTIPASTTLVRGSVIGIVTATGVGILSDSDAVDGSQNLHSILAEDVSTGVGETKVVSVYKTGQFNENQLVFGGDDTAADRKTEARALSIFFETAVKTY